MNDITKLTIQEFRTQKKYELPNIQRGFVWKPHQIEDLWNSLFQNYLIGSFIVKGDQILDGQQRLTSIKLAFREDAYRADVSKYRIFVDLHKNEVKTFEKSDDEYNLNEDELSEFDFNFRVITSSHPWGYNLSNNKDPLSSEDKSNALDLFEKKLGRGINEFYQEDILKFWPYDSYLPIPLDILLNNVEDKKSQILKWLKDTFNVDYERLFISGENNVPTKHFSELKNKDELYSLDELIKKVDLVLKTQLFFLDVNCANTEEAFKRINAKGTPISSEELNYSLIKNKFNNVEMFKKFDDQCSGIAKPASILTMLFRLFQIENKINNYSLNIKTKNFEVELEKKSGKFSEFIEKFIENEYLKRYKNLLKYQPKTNEFGLPYPLFVKFNRVAPELMFLLLYRIYFKNDDENIEYEDRKKKLIGGITLLYFFYRSGKAGYRKVFNKIKCLLNENFDDFWSKGLKERADLLQLDEIDEVTEVIDSKKINIPEDFREKTFSCNKEYSASLEKIYRNRDFLLYAQREALHKFFGDDLFELDDTNMPFDDDHISPKSFIESKKNVYVKIRNVYETNGNHRFWPYNLNRSDHDNVLIEKFSVLDESGKLKKQYQNSKIIKTDEDLLVLSLCNENWLLKDYSYWDLKKDSNSDNKKDLYVNIMNRNKNIYDKWFDDLDIENKYFYDENSFDFRMLLNNIFIKKSIKCSEKEDSDDIERLHYFLENEGRRIYFYLDEKDDNPFLEDDIFVEIIPEEWKIKKIPDDSEEGEEEVGKKRKSCYKSFTLKSLNLQKKLVSDIRDWLLSFKNADLLNAFDTCLKVSVK